MTDWRRPAPFLITPETEDEANFGKPTLLTEGNLYILIAALEADHFKEYCRPLIAKLERLKDCG